MRKWIMAGAATAVLAFASMAPAYAEYLTEHRGGTMRLVARSAAGTLDPQINYTLQYWQIYQSVYSGLTAFKKGAGEEGFKVVPNLAEELPAATNDGKTYVFKLLPAHLQDLEPDVGRLLFGDRRRRQVHRRTGNLHA